MKVGEIIKQLVTAQNYAEVRMTVDDSFIDFVKDNMPSQYELFKEKEEIYIALANLTKEFKIE